MQNEPSELTALRVIIAKATEGRQVEKPLANSFARAIPYSRSSLSEPLFGTQTVIVINSR